jgi:CDP-glucose 4,6-dehydratase
MTVDRGFWRGKRVFLTGHTGFKGSWLSLWLQQMGAELQGFALQPPTSPALFSEARVGDGMSSTIGDVRDRKALFAALHSFRPEIIFHLAAQPLVRLSYVDPVETYATNVMGTVHLLDAVRQAKSVRVVVNVTTDKCYENREWVWGYRESDPMGGHDPYSSSKGCAELVTNAYRRSFFPRGTAAIASVRAGNVIGGGDWGADRLVPDILRALEKGLPVFIRNPHSVRPWQHVLEPLAGYLILAQQMWEHGDHLAEGWNFGPRDEDARSVQWIVEHMASIWGGDAHWQLDVKHHAHEAAFLKLDISKASARLGWYPRWDISTALIRTVDWHRAWLYHQDVQTVCINQISEYAKSKQRCIEHS